MKLEELKRAAVLFVQNYPGNISVFLFGSTARKNKPVDDWLGETHANDIDLLFLVDLEAFSEFIQQCNTSGVDFINGEPLDRFDCFWEYHSPRQVRFEATFEFLNIDKPLEQQLSQVFKNEVLDILILPFGWEKNEDVLDILNREDQNFSQNISRDAKLLFSQGTSS